MARAIKDKEYNQLGRKDPKRAAIYIRVSTDEQAKHGLSLDAQKKTLEDYCIAHGHRIVGFYVDEGLTARKTIKKRIQFNRMIEDVKQDKIDLVVFIKLDRWFRNVRDYYNTMDILDQHNCTWVATEEDYDLTTSSGILNLNLRLSISQNESDVTSDRINFVFANRRADGYVTSGSCPFGYKIENKRYVINEEKAERVRDIFNHFIATGSVDKTLMHYRNTYGYISINSIRKYLTNTAYIGQYKTKHGELLEDYTPAIVDEDIFNKAQSLIRKNVRRSRNDDDPNDFIFGGLLYCDSCGAKLSRNGKQKASKSKGIKFYHYYRCYNSTARNCENKKCVNQVTLEKEMLMMLKTEANKYIAENKIKGTKQAKKPKDNTGKIKTKLKNIRELFIDGDIDKTEYVERKMELEKELADNLALLKDENSPKDTRHLEGIINGDFETIYHTLTNENKRRFWASIIDKIYIENKVVTKIIFL